MNSQPNKYKNPFPPFNNFFSKIKGGTYVYLPGKKVPKPKTKAMQHYLKTAEELLSLDSIFLEYNLQATDEGDLAQLFHSS